MARPLRIEYPGAWYHIMNRGRRYEEIFIDDGDYQMFPALLKETSDIWNIRIAAYCLMPNHYHLLIQTPEANLSKAMRQINGIYTQIFNRKHGYDGPLFRGRYKSILVSEDYYLLALVRYIHRNPIKAGIVDSLDKYKWSSHNGYLSAAKKWNWLHKKFILSMLSPDHRDWRKEYRHFVNVEEDGEIENILERKKWPPVMGPKEFVDRVKDKYYTLKIDDEVPESKRLAPEVEEIMGVVSAFYKVNTDDILHSQRGVINEPRNVTVYLIRMLRHDSLKQIGAILKLEKYSSISSIIERMKKQIREDPTLKKKIEKLTQKITKSQEQT
ncbi:MAG: transposase [candidate division Zixibacteria bacterium]|nr:transposase [candidate division Zixibacteria bacterium]